MFSNKLLQKILIINGIMFPIVLIFILFSSIKSEFFSKEGYETTYRGGDGMIVGEELKEAKKKNLTLQGIYFYPHSLEKIFNSENYYIPLYLNTYEEARAFEDAVTSAGDINPYNLMNACNVLFLDKNYGFISLLLSKKASVRDVHIERSYIKIDNEKEIPDTTMKNIVYQIGFEDTNKDGLLDKEDAHDLFISDLDGKNLRQVTQNFDIERFEFQNNHSELFIIYKERTNERAEYKRNKLAIYDISKKALKKLTEIDKAIDDFERVIRE